MNKYIIGFGVIVLTVFFFVYGSGNSKKAIEVTPTLVSSEVVVVEKPYDFGDIDIFGGKVSTTFTIRNNGPEDVVITSAVTSCSCTSGEIEDLKFDMHNSTNKEVTITAGESKELIAIYNPLAHGPNGTGRVTRELYMTTNSKITPKIKAVFTANVVKMVKK